MRLFALIFILSIVIVTPFLIFDSYIEQLFGGQSIIVMLSHFHAWAGVVAMALLISDVITPIPASAIMAACGVLYGPLTGGLISCAGNFLSGQVAYLVCRLFGQPAAKWILGEQELQQEAERFDRIGIFAVAGSRALPILPEVTACMAGLLNMSWRRFSLALAMGSAVAGFGFAWLGHTGRAEPTLIVIAATLLPPLLWLIASRLGLLRFR